MATGNEGTPRGVQALNFDPDKYPHCVLKAFNEFVEQYSFRYDAQYPCPPKHAIYNEIVIWKSEHDNVDPSIEQLKGIQKYKIIGYHKTRCRNS